MPIQHAIWKVGDHPAPLGLCRLPSEQKLEDMIVSDLGILSSEWMLIGRQEVTSHGGRFDLLAIAPDASLILIELKRKRAARDTIAQALDYASWVEGFSAEKIAQIYHRFSSGGSLDDAFQERSCDTVPMLKGRKRWLADEGLRAKPGRPCSCPT